jgi:hypothetical protein
VSAAVLALADKVALQQALVALVVVVHTVMVVQELAVKEILERALMAAAVEVQEMLVLEALVETEQHIQLQEHQ